MATRTKVKVGILMGSDSDLPIMKECGKILEAHGIAHELKILSAHRTPAETTRYVKGAPARGIQVLIAGAGGAAHLAGAVAAHSVVPVIGVPLEGTIFKGTDAYLATLQMPPGVPVATVSVGKWGAKNAAYLAIQILALSDKRLNKAYQQWKKTMRAGVLAKDKKLQKNCC